MSATGASLLLRLGAAVAAFLLSLLIARRYGAEGAGVFAIASTVMAIASIVCLFGLDIASVRAVSSYHAEGRWPTLRAWTTTAVLIVIPSGGAVALAIWLGAGAVSRLVDGSDALTYSIAVLGLAGLPVAVTRLLGGFLRGTRRFVQASLLDPFLISAGVLLVLLIAPASSIQEVVVAYAIVAYVVALCGCLLWLRVSGSHGRAREEIMVGTVLKQSLTTYGTVLGAFATPWVTVLVLGAFASEAEAGIYRVAAQFALLLAIVLQAVETGMSPQFAALQAKRELHSVASAAHRMVGLLLIVGGVPSLVVLVFAEPLLAIFGSEFTAGTTALRILMAAQVALLAMGPVGSVLLMTGLGRLSLWNSIAGASIVLVLSLLLIPAYGLEGAAAAAGITIVFRAVAATMIVWFKRGLFLPLGLVKAPKTAGG